MRRKKLEQQKRVQKKMKNKIFAIILTVLLALPISVSAVDTVINEPSAVSEVLSAEGESVLEKEVSEISENEIEDAYKQPLSTKKIAKKFLMAMLGVGVSSFLIFFGLSVYNRVRESVLNNVKTPEGETSLKTPEDMTSAIRVFIEKTMWK